MSSITFVRSINAQSIFLMKQLMEATREDAISCSIETLLKARLFILNNKKWDLNCIFFTALTERELSIPCSVFQQIQPKLIDQNPWRKDLIVGRHKIALKYFEKFFPTKCFLSSEEVGLLSVSLCPFSSLIVQINLLTMFRQVLKLSSLESVCDTSDVKIPGSRIFQPNGRKILLDWISKIRY